jgi:hypothetical protein
MVDQANTAIIRITATAITISFGSNGFRFIENSLHQEGPENQICSRNSLYRENLGNLDSFSLPFHCLYCSAHCTGQNESLRVTPVILSWPYLSWSIQSSSQLTTHAAPLKSQSLCHEKEVLCSLNSRHFLAGRTVPITVAKVAD